MSNNQPKWTSEGLPVVSTESFLYYTEGLVDNAGKSRSEAVVASLETIAVENPVIAAYINKVVGLCPMAFKPRLVEELTGMYDLLESPS